MTEIEKIINDAGTPYGFCEFSAVENRLLECRAKSRIPENAKTVILFIFPYKVADEKPKNISRYAAVPDYHPVLLKRMSETSARLKAVFPQNEFVPFCDNSPIPEVFAASSAGLGVIGKNGLLISKNYGSFVFIGEIVTDLEIKAQSKPSYCEACGMCLRACPVALDKKRCISAVSQKKGDLTENEIKLLTENKTVWGCDICQNACPLNRNCEKTFIPEFLNGYRDEYVRGEDISGRAYEWRGEKTVLRNALFSEK